MTRFPALLLICFVTAIGSVGQQPSRDVITSNCSLAGTWTQNSEGLGPSTWTITENGDATESGLGNAKGKASLSGRTLRIDWTIPGYNNSGYYQWTLGDDCRGPGISVNTVSGVRRNTNVARNADVAAIHAELRGVPTEIWVGWGRPSMSAKILITGFRRNTAEPVILDCPDATNLSGDHPDRGGDPFKRVQISPCGENQQTYNWPLAGYEWGILISAPQKDDGAQPGRTSDICLGTNPVRLRVSQKGAGSAIVTISPQLVRKAGLVGGGGTYEPGNCKGPTGDGGGGEGSIRAVLSGAPSEVWVGYGRPSMSANISITGFKRNSPDPVVLDCPDAINLSGDHPDPPGNRLKRIQISPCGSNQLTYDWPVGSYDWGIMISAPERDDNSQPGRPRDVCLGTNPVRLRVSQKGAGSAFVTISPELVLKAGLVGGGGTYGASDCGGPLTNAGRFAIQTSSGNFLTAVRGGGIEGAGAINSDATQASGWETFEFEQLSEGKVAIKTVNGNYLTAMRGGGLTGSDVMHSDGRRVDAWEKFTLERQTDGTYAIKTANGNYLTAVSGGGVGGGRGAIHTNATSVSGWEKFKLVPIPGSGGSGFEQETDRKGQDYQPLELPQPEPKICNDACAADPKCKAWTYVKPNIYGPKAYCYLKSGVPPATPNSCCVSGVKAGASEPTRDAGTGTGNSTARTAGNDGFSESLNNVTLKGDILRYYGGSSAERCRSDCVANGNCKGYTFVRAGGYSPSDPAMCYLLTKVTERTAHSCCVSGERSGTSEPTTNAQKVTWATGASYRGQNVRVTYDCPPGGNASMGNVWGTDYYTYDSSVCIAAVHMGLITFANGGRVTFEMRQGAATYKGSTRNGVRSADWGAYDGSYVFVP